MSRQYNENSNIGFRLFLGSMACGLTTASKMLGFKTPTAFIAWLRKNDFMNEDHLPSGYLIRNRWMNYDLETTRYKVKYDSCGFAINGDEFMDGVPISYRNIPLITKAGVNLIKTLLTNKQKLQEVLAEIKLDNLKKLKYANF